MNNKFTNDQYQINSKINFKLLTVNMYWIAIKDNIHKLVQTFWSMLKLKKIGVVFNKSKEKSRKDLNVYLQINIRYKLV